VSSRFLSLRRARLLHRKFRSQTLCHCFFTARRAASMIQRMARAKRAVMTNFDRNLIGRTTNTAGANFKAWLNVFQGIMENAQAPAFDREASSRSATGAHVLVRWPFFSRDSMAP
jgi:hypothetical protein